MDTGASNTLVPRSILTHLGVVPEEEWPFVMADGREVAYQVAEARIRIDGRIHTTTVVFGPEDVEPLLGVITLEEFRLGVDPVGQRLIPVPGRLK